ncbi:MAG: hypothetical protein J6B04_05280 [Clostridia bacterium]|nr:hypothetical protein [Clostridia bacterium]
MFYCDKCKTLCEDNICNNCGASLRVADKGDFCFFTECDNYFGEILKDAFDKNKIPSSFLPYGSGVSTNFACKLENYRVYVPYEFYNAAVDVYNFFYDDLTEEYKNKLLKNIGEWYLKSERFEKKIKKTLKLLENKNLAEFLKKEIKNAESISDQGAIGGCKSGGHYLYVRANNCTIMFNSATYEVLAVNAKKK